MPVEITDADEICRCIIYDRAFEQDLHVDALLWQFGPTMEDGASHESAVLRRLAPLPEDVHRIGCAIAAGQNERKNNPPPGINRRYYCGFRSASYRSLPKKGEGFSICLKNAPEHGAEAHVDVALTITVQGKSAKANCRTNAGLALAEQFGPPAPHRCACDEDDEYHPIAIWGVHCLIGGLRDRWPGLILTHSNDRDEIDESNPGY